MRNFTFITRKTRKTLSRLDCSKSSALIEFRSTCLSTVDQNLHSSSLSFSNCVTTQVSVPALGKKLLSSQCLNKVLLIILITIALLPSHLCCVKLWNLYSVSIFLSILKRMVSSMIDYGFRKARSTGDILTYVTELWSPNLNKGGGCPAVSFDI